MVRIDSQVGEEERFAARPVASAVWFHGHKHGIDLRQRLGVVKLQHPALVGGIVDVKDTEIKFGIVGTSKATESTIPSRVSCAELTSKWWTAAPRASSRLVSDFIRSWKFWSGAARGERPIISLLLGWKVRVNKSLGVAFQVATTRRKDFSSQMVFQPDIEWRRAR
jgi:hypothetical protein